MSTLGEGTFGVGILGTANIARKNILAIAQAKNVCTVVVGSRDPERARVYAEENDVPRSYGSYEEVLADGEVDGVYLPLPTTSHFEWVQKAAEKRKHILCEKPLALNAKDLLTMLRAAKAADVAFMDGVMFMHHHRMTRLREACSNLGPTGPRQVNTHFSFKGDASFFENNIRVSANGDPLGCVGDLGWYNVRFSLFVFNYEMPSSVRCIVHRSSDDGVPFQASGTMIWSDDDDLSLGVPLAARSATFVCSFLHTECQSATVVGENGFIEMEDFVIPVSPSVGRFTKVKHNWGPKAQHIDAVRLDEDCHSNQTSAMWETFSAIANDAAQRPFWMEVALKTQVVMDALMQSSQKNGEAVVLPPIQEI